MKAEKKSRLSVGFSFILARRRCRFTDYTTNRL